MKIKRFLLGSIILAGILLIGCGKEKNKKEEVNNNYEKQENIDVKGEQKLPEDILSTVFNGETDSPLGVEYCQIAKSPYGYYMWCSTYMGAPKMTYYDMSGERYIILCNRAECIHRDDGLHGIYDEEECNGTLGLMHNTGNTIDDYVFYYDGNIYVSGFTAEGYEMLYKVSPDGTKVEEYMKIMKGDTSGLNDDNPDTGWMRPSMIIHRGYIYYIDNREKQMTVRRKKLGSDKEEVVFRNDGEFSLVYRMRAYGNYVFFQSGNYADNICSNFEGGIYAYNIENGKVILVKKGAVAPYCIAEGKILYMQGGAIREYDMATAEVRKIIDINYIEDFYADNQYVYIKDKDSDKITVYDYNGEHIYSILPDDNLLNIYGIDDDMLLGKGDMGFFCIKKSELFKNSVGTEDIEWNRMFLETVETE